MIQVQSAPYAGTAYLNGAAVSRGHELVLCLSNNINGIVETIGKEKPDIIGFSCMSSFLREIVSISTRIKKKFDIPIILGGPHPTLFPEVINEPSIDMICRGEGEFALIELLEALEKGKPYFYIKNLWVKLKNKIYKNQLRPLVDPLDEVPLINWGCYRGTAVKNSSPIVFLIRGCPYSCSYCFNKSTRELYRGLGNYVRHFTVKRSIQEIESALEFFPPSPVLFTSDTFGVDLEWMDELFAEYSKITQLPFVLLLRPDLVTDRCIEVLSKYKCYSIALGIESGSERVRREILNRNYSNRYLVDIANLLHNNNIKFRSYNMIGLPTETEDEMWETIDINIKMKTDFPRAAIFTPMPNTRIVEIAKEHGYLNDDFSFDDIPASILTKSILKNVNHERIENTLHFFQTTTVFPRLRGILRKLTHIKPNLLFRLWFYLMYVYLHRMSEQRPLITYIKYLFANRQYKG